MPSVLGKATLADKDKPPVCEYALQQLHNRSLQKRPSRASAVPRRKGRPLADSATLAAVRALT